MKLKKHDSEYYWNKFVYISERLKCEDLNPEDYKKLNEIGWQMYRFYMSELMDERLKTCWL